MKFRKTQMKLSKKDQVKANVVWGLAMLKRLHHKSYNLLRRMYDKDFSILKINDLLSKSLKEAFSTLRPSSRFKRITSSTMLNLIECGEVDLLNKFVYGQKLTSVGLMLTDGDLFLGVHPTKSTFWDIPKGIREKGENTVQTVIREVGEECGINLTSVKNKLELIGKFPYLRNKDLVIYLLEIGKLPNTSRMKCRSFFDTPKGVTLPEVDRWKYFRLGDFNKFSPNLAKVLSKVVNMLWLPNI